MVAYAKPANFKRSQVGACYQSATVIAPADNTQIGPFSGLWVGGAGNVVVCMANGDGAGGVTTVTFTGVLAGTLLPIAIQGVNNTLTTATNLVGLA